MSSFLVVFRTRHKDSQPFKVENTLTAFMNVAPYENAVRNQLLRRQRENDQKKRLARSGVDARSIKGDSLNQYIEGARVVPLDQLFSQAAVQAEDPSVDDVMPETRKNYLELKTLDLKGADAPLNIVQLMNMDASHIADQVLLQRYVAEDPKGWETAIYHLQKKLEEMPVKDFIALASERRNSDDLGTPKDYVLDYFLAKEARRRHTPVIGRYGNKLKGHKKAAKITAEQSELDATAGQLYDRVRQYVEQIDNNFMSDVTVRRRKEKQQPPPRSKYKSIAIVGGLEALNKKFEGN